MPGWNRSSIGYGVSAAALLMCVGLNACSERDRIDAQRPACEKIYQEETARLLDNVRAVGRAAVPLNPTYAELRALFGPEDGRPLGERVACARLVWRPMPYRESVPDIPIGACARSKAEGAFDLAKFREAFFSTRHPAAIEAVFDRTTIDSEIKAAAVSIRSPFPGTLGGLPLDVDSATFRRHAEERGWHSGVRWPPMPDHVRPDACQGQLLICNKTVDVFYRYDSEIYRNPKFRLKAGICNGRVQEIQIWDLSYGIEPELRPPL
jgi:hypothetical protein